MRNKKGAINGLILVGLIIGIITIIVALSYGESEPLWTVVSIGVIWVVANIIAMFIKEKSIF